MKERSIRFSDTEVRAILEGQKTQTRRIVKPQPVFDGYWSSHAGYHVNTEKGFREGMPLFVKCPHGTVGDRLWVRETWLPLDADHVIGNVKCAYGADGTPDGEEIRLEYIKRGRKYQWRPSIHMPRWASRITLEITGVRVERLQDISEEDAIAEGCICPNYGIDDYWKKAGDPDTPADVFMALWKSINGPESWDANPWVWVIGFRRVDNG